MNSKDEATSLKGKRLERSFFVRPGEDKAYAERTVEIAENLLGKFVVRRIGRRKICGQIVEVEVCAGPKDRDGKINPKDIVRAKRIGIDYAGPYWSSRRWRFYLKESFAVSKK